MKVYVRITKCEISSAGFMIKEAWMMDGNGNFVSNANINSKFAVAMKGTDITLEVSAAVNKSPAKGQPEIEIKDPRQKDLFLDSGKK
tara:strand:- start:1051 stop:1311 length:261 start_codon:yes stop_codon:yes gene_type:complete